MKLKDDVKAHPSVREAQESVQAAVESHDEVETEVEGLRADLDELSQRIVDTQEAGDPEGVIRRLSKERRGLRAELEDAEADLAAQDGAVTGAVAVRDRTILKAMGDVWSAIDHDGVATRFREAVTALQDSLDELDELAEQENLLRGWARHIVVQKLDGQADFPALRSPELGISTGNRRELTAAVRRHAPRIETEPNTEPQEAAA